MGIAEGTCLIHRDLEDTRMSGTERIFNIFVAAPGDILEERSVIESVIKDWNTHRGRAAGARAEVVWWKNRARPRMGDRPQEIINVDVLDNADIVVGIFWTRFGTPTGEADSGTEEEIRRSVAAGKDVLLYFCDRPVKPSDLDSNQYARVQAFRQEIQAKRAGLFWEYSDTRTFRDEFSAHISVALTGLFGDSAATPAVEREAIVDQDVAVSKVPGMGTTFSPQLSKLDALMPKVKREFSDRDRIQFMETGFREIHDFMKAALDRLAQKEQDIQTDFRDITSVHFACRVYRHGDLVSQCKIWIGRQLGSMGIYYAGDDVETPVYNAFNDWLTLEDDGHALFFKASGFAVSFRGQEASKLSAQNAGVHFWSELTAHLADR